MPPRKIILDTDPGQDDAVAIMLALASPGEIEVLGITTVAGNVPLHVTSDNALKICELVGKPPVKVFAGCDRPLKRELVTAEHIHGPSGMSGTNLPDPRIALQDGHAVDFIIETLRQEPSGTITLCPVGPLTNIATAFNKAPDIIDKVQEIVLMGGACFQLGNTTPAAEFNIYVDPDAADIVFRSGVPIVAMPLDVTYKARVTSAHTDAFRALQSSVGVAVSQMTGGPERYNVPKYGGEGTPLHDPCVIAYLIQPSLFSGQHVHVAIETQSELTVGMTVVDWWHTTGRDTNAYVVGDIDADGFFSLLTERLAQL